MVRHKHIAFAFFIIYLPFDDGIAANAINYKSRPSAGHFKEKGIPGIFQNAYYQERKEQDSGQGDYQIKPDTVKC